MAKKKFQVNAEEYEVFNAPEKKDDVKKDIPIHLIDSDPDNEVIFGEITEESVKHLADDIRENGFKGDVIVYPTEDGRYMLESGHRRLQAAKMAGYDTVPVFITEKPRTDSERRIRLISMNLHNREKIKPSVFVNIINELSSSYKAENPDCGQMEIQKFVAMKTELSEKTIERYRLINRLIDELKDLIDNTPVSWSAVVHAASLSDDLQRKVYSEIKDEIDRVGDDRVSRDWIISLCQSLKDNGKKTAPEPKTRVRSKNVAKGVSNCHKGLMDILGDNTSMLKKKDVPVVTMQLREMQELISKKLEEIETEYNV